MARIDQWVHSPVTYLCRYVFLVLWSAFFFFFFPPPNFVMYSHWQSSTRGRSQIWLEVREDSTIYYCLVNPFMLCWGPGWTRTHVGTIVKKNPQNSLKLFLNILQIFESLCSSVNDFFLPLEPCKNLLIYKQNRWFKKCKKVLKIRENLKDVTLTQIKC
jgi:hypothetical protein